MSNFNDAGASRFSGSTHANRGLGATSRGAGNATTISTGVVTDVIPQKTGAIHLVCQPSNNSPTVNGKVEVLLLLPQAYENGGTMMSPRVGDKIVWLTAGATSYYLGSAPQETAKPSFLGETSDDATADNTGGEGMLVTGMRMPDQTLNTEVNENGVKVSNARTVGAPGTNKPEVPETNRLIDSKTSRLRSLDDVKNAVPEGGERSPDEPYSIPEEKMLRASLGFQRVMRGVNEMRDPAYKSAKGLGYSEVSIKARKSRLASNDESESSSD